MVLVMGYLSMRCLAEKFKPKKCEMRTSSIRNFMATFRNSELGDVIQKWVIRFCSLRR